MFILVWRSGRFEIDVEIIREFDLSEREMQCERYPDHPGPCRMELNGEMFSWKKDCNDIRRRFSVSPFGVTGEVYYAYIDELSIEYVENSFHDTRAVICGHIHEDYGHYRVSHPDMDYSNVYNVSYVNLGYEPANRPVVINL